MFALRIIFLLVVVAISLAIIWMCINYFYPVKYNLWSNVLAVLLGIAWWSPVDRFTEEFFPED